MFLDLSGGIEPNGLSEPPGEYSRKSETQKDRRGNTQAVDYLD